jgi:hypothetical protein
MEIQYEGRYGQSGKRNGIRINNALIIFTFEFILTH